MNEAPVGQLTATTIPRWRVVRGGNHAIPAAPAQLLGSGALLASTRVPATLLAAVAATLLGGATAFLSLGCGCLRCLEHALLLSVG